MTYFAVETQTFENMSSKAKQKVSVNYIMTKSVSWFWMCLLFKDSSLLLQTDRNHIFFCGKVLFSLGVRLAVAYIITAQIWKSLHIVAAIAVAVLTREREISTCPDHIPALALNSTHLLCKLESTPRSLSAKYSDKRMDKSGRRDCVTTWSRYPDTLRNSMRHSRNPTRLSWITLHRSSIKRDVPQGNRGEKREDWCRSQLFASTLCQSGRILSQQCKYHSLGLNWIQPASTPATTLHATATLCKPVCDECKMHHNHNLLLPLLPPHRHCLFFIQQLCILVWF